MVVRVGLVPQGIPPSAVKVVVEVEAKILALAEQEVLVGNLVAVVVEVLEAQQ